MFRNDLVLIGLGGAGNRLVDTIINVDDRFQNYFINTSITDLESLENFNRDTRNFLCISQQNGVGRNKNIGKSFAEQSSSIIVDKILSFQQNTIFLASSLGGGSGSSILTTTLDAFTQIRDMGSFDKTVNLICIIPDLKSPEVILRNSIQTWTDIFKYKDIVNSIIFIDNGSLRELSDDEDRESYINQEFAELFDSIFDIPLSNGIKFDNGNLSNVLNDKGCLYFYNLKNNMGNINLALRKAEQESVLAKMDMTEQSTLEIDGKRVIKCGYLGVSLNDEKYHMEELVKNYHVRREVYDGFNEENNLVILSGCTPPNATMGSINLEIKERERARQVEEEDIFVASFEVPANEVAFTSNPSPKINNNSSIDMNNSNKKLKKVLKKNLFKQK